jgi:hypothetical protein
MTTHSFRYEGPIVTTGQLTASAASLTGMTANYAVYNNGSGVLATEELLAVGRGGLGAMTGGVLRWATTAGAVDPGGSPTPVNAVFPAVLGGNTGVFDRVGAAVLNVPNTVVMRDGSGVVTNPIILCPSSTSVALTMSNAYNTVTEFAQCYARTSSGSATLFALSAAGYGANAALYFKGYIALMRNSGGGANTDHGTYEFVARAAYSAGAPGTWTVASPLVYESKDLSAALAASAVTVTSAGDSIYATVTNNAVSSVDWSGFVQVTYEKQLA